MPFRYQISVEESDGQVTEIGGQFADEVWSTLQRFRTFVEELNTAEYVQAGLPLKDVVKWTAAEGWVPPQLPSSAVLREFLLMLRPFVLEREPTSVPRICRVLGYELQHPILRGDIKRARDAFLGRDVESLFRISVSEFVLNSEDALHLWLNAFEYHRDEEKRRKLQELHAGATLETSKGIFLLLLRDKVRAIWMLYGMISHLKPNAPDSAAQAR
jgi:hypothetical protein